MVSWALFEKGSDPLVASHFSLDFLPYRIALKVRSGKAFCYLDKKFSFNGKR